MKKLWSFKGAYFQSRWYQPAYFLVDEQGQVVTASEEKPDVGDGVAQENIEGWFLPGMTNAHSHAFQYVMIGLAENISILNPEDDFWTWREKMYHLAGAVTPEDVEAVAAHLYQALLDFGYTSVVEFHYLHHDEQGQSYPVSTEMSDRLVAAAKKVGIDLTLVPVFYQKGGFKKAAGDLQKRFLFKDAEGYLSFCQELQRKYQQEIGVHIGMGGHSLRAAPIEGLRDIVSQLGKETVFHIHIAEQIKEVEECLSVTGRRPIDYLMDEIECDKRFNFVHATHTTQGEIHKMVQAQVNVVICPSTEANLGDGFFNLSDFHRSGGRWCIGSDSHVGRDPYEELRWLEHGQRLLLQKRNPLCLSSEKGSGLELLDKAWSVGETARGNFSPKAKMTGVVLPDDEFTRGRGAISPDVWGHWVFSSHIRPLGVLLRGEKKGLWQVEKTGQREDVNKKFIQVLKTLKLK